MRTAISSSQAIGGAGANGVDGYDGSQGGDGGDGGDGGYGVSTTPPGGRGGNGGNGGTGGSGGNGSDGGNGGDGGAALGGAIYFGASAEFTNLGGNSIAGQAMAGSPGAGGSGGAGAAGGSGGFPGGGGMGYFQNAVGSQSTDGLNGSAGVSGASGAHGTNGATGADGAAGMQGNTIDGSPNSATQATHLAVLYQPGGTPVPGQVDAGAPFGMTVVALDASGAIDANDHAAISISLGNNPNQATLAGDDEVYPQSGIATFTNLHMDRGGLNVTLQASSDGSAGATTAPFNVLGYTPAQIRQAYGFDQLSLNGAGQTIAIVVPYNNPNLLPSSDIHYQTSDLSIFDQAFGLPDQNVLSKVGENGSSTLPGTGTNPNWQFEAALDVEWAHATAPQAQIVLVETNSASVADIIQGVATAKNISNVSVVLVGVPFFGLNEDQSELSLDSAFTTPAFHQGITFVTGSGDYGGGLPAYPGTSPNVVSVGGTSLTINSDNSYQAESGWSQSSGGPSEFEPEPPYQTADQSTAKRTSPDVSFDADPETGVAVYDAFTSAGSTSPWTIGDGTMVGALAWAGLLALVDQGRLMNGEGSLDGPSQTLPALYSVPSQDFNDVISGESRLYSASPGYDFVTGLGSPRVNLLVPDLVKFAAPVPSYHLAITSPLPKSAIVAGVPYNLAVSVEDSHGKVDTNFNGLIQVTLSGSPPGVQLGGSTFAIAVRGTAVFRGLLLTLAGSGYHLIIASPGFSPLITPQFKVVAGPTVKIKLLTQPPGTVSAGAGFGLRLEALNAYGNITTKYSGKLTVSLLNNTTHAVLKGRLSLKMTGGFATFSRLSITTAGQGYTLRVSAPRLKPVVTSPFNVTPGPASQLRFVTPPPSSVIAGAGFGFMIQAVDKYGNVASGFQGSVKVALAANPGKSTLGGVVSVTAQLGVASFTGLTLNNVGRGYVIKASAGALTVSTKKFNVTPALVMVV